MPPILPCPNVPERQRGGEEEESTSEIQTFPSSVPIATVREDGRAAKHVPRSTPEPQEEVVQIFFVGRRI